jgi:hypothetical protein
MASINQYQYHQSMKYNGIINWLSPKSSVAQRFIENSALASKAEM